MKLHGTWCAQALILSLGATAMFHYSNLATAEDAPPAQPTLLLTETPAAPKIGEPTGPVYMQLPDGKLVPMPAEPKKDAKDGKDAKKKSEPKSAWLTHPPVRPVARPGNFGIPTKGPGYYSARDQHHGEFRESPPPAGYAPFLLSPPGFFDADFRYVDANKKYEPDFLEKLHRIHIGDDWLFATGGSMWYRYLHEGSSRTSGRDNTYDQFRLRAFADLWYKDRFRIFVEGITAQTFGLDLNALPIDRNYADLQNAFVDIALWESDCTPWYLRLGRQELVLGSQRLISTLDWANTRRTFQGARLMHQGKEWDIDLFWLQFVRPNVTRFDSVDNNTNFAGAWVTHRPRKGVFLDMYYLFLDNTNRVTQQGIGVAPFNVHTIGARYAGDKDNFLWDVEGMLQFGERGPQNTFAGAFTIGGGYHFKCSPWSPVVWAYYDYASGDRNPNAGNYNTFNQLFPFGHYYLGFLDQVGRQNIHDVNFHLYAYPNNWITLNAQYHIYRLDSARDALYNAGGNAIRRSATGAAGRDVGSEIDLLVNFHLGRHSDVILGYSHIFAGDFLARTGSGKDLDQFYAMYQFRW